MGKTKKTGKKYALLATIGFLTFLLANVQGVFATESSCVTCHLDKEMLKKTVAAPKGKKSSMQSGAG